MQFLDVPPVDIKANIQGNLRLRVGTIIIRDLEIPNSNIRIRDILNSPPEFDPIVSDMKEVASDEAKPTEKSTVSSLAGDPVDEEIVAAIAVAIAQVRTLELCEVGLGSTLEGAPSRWWHTGRAQQSPANALRTNPWRRER